MRFRCLHKSGGHNTLAPKRAVRVIMATAILHNVCFRNRVPLPDDDSDTSDTNDDDNDKTTSDSEIEDGHEQVDNTMDGCHSRANLINRCFA